MTTNNHTGQGIVLAVHPNLVSILIENEIVTIPRPLGQKKQNCAEILVGDRVQIHHGSIALILPRCNHFSRRAAAARPGGRCGEQKIAANVDQVIAVLAAQNPAPKWNLLDRYLSAAEAADLPALICITKVDLLKEQDPFRVEMQAELAVYQRMGYPIVLTSTQTAAGLADLQAALTEKTSLLIGKSGVGKSSLMNALYPQAARAVGEVGSHSGKGRHTTSAAWMQVVGENTALIDTPGTREFGLWFGEEDLGYTFRDLREQLGACRFGLDCRHDEEPGCAVRQAVMAGEIHPRRYQSYLRLLDEEAGQ
jgi:ribosome biogenesis GTPase